MLLGRQVLRSPAPPGEVLRRVERLLSRVPTASISDASAGGGRHPCRGVIDGSRFAFRRVRASGRRSFLRVRGQVAGEGQGTRIQVRLGLAGLAPLAALAVLAAAGAAAAHVVVRTLREGGVPGVEVWRVVVFLITAAAVLLAVAWERQRVGRLLHYLTGEMTHAALAHELADRE